MSKQEEINYVMDGSLDRPAWTSTQETGMFEAYKHKHTLYRGSFVLLRDFYKPKK